MSIRTDCWNLDLAFYHWAAKRLTYMIEYDLGHPSAHNIEEWKAILTEMRDVFREAAASRAMVYTPTSPRLRRALKTWATELPHLWT